ncbi:molybdopterin-guanine dinucleotide biosynthesis protein MobB [Desulfovibrio sp.]
MKAVAVVGFKKSGKTALTLELLEAARSLGLSVAAGKHSHHGFDEKEGTDTARFRALGCPVLAWSPGGAQVFWPDGRTLPDLAPLVTADLLVCEGGKTQGLMPRIILADDEATARELEPELALAVYGKTQLPGLPRLEAPEALARLAADKGFLLPGLNCGGCGREDCRALAVDIVAGKASPSDCVSLHGGLSVSVGGRPLALNPFVARMFGAGVLAMLAELKGFGPGDVEIRLER